MRMRELSERSGLPRTTIHHYIREGLLPPARKSAPNAAEYDDAHLQRLRMITTLRGEEYDAMPLDDVRRVLEMTEAGANLDTAARLVRRGVSANAIDPGGPASASDLATASGTDDRFVRGLVDAGVLLRDESGGFAPGDVVVTRVCAAACADGELEPADLAPLADLLREAGNYSRTLADLAALRRRGGSPEPESQPVAGGALSDLCETLLWRSFSE